MNEILKIQVECHSGYTAHERPLCFSVGDNKHTVTDVIDRWYGPDYLYFKVIADDGNTYIIRYAERNDEWELEYFRKAEDR